MPTENFSQANLEEADTPELLIPSVEQHLTRLRTIRASVTANLEQARLRQKEYADRHRRDLAFDVGEYVLLSTRNLQLRGA